MLVQALLIECVVMHAEVVPCQKWKQTMHCTAKANIQGVEGGEGEALHC